MHYSQEVMYHNTRAHVTLSATLSVPKLDILKKYPAVLLVPGYGMSDRDLTGMGHKRFLVLADYLNSQGIAVLRYDKRGVGKSTGDFSVATTADFADDAYAGIEYLKQCPEVDSNNIGIIGLSEGGLIASMVAAKSSTVKFIVLMAPALCSDLASWLEYVALQFRADGASEKFIAHDRIMREKIYYAVTQQPDHQTAAKQLYEIINDYCLTMTEQEKFESEKLHFAFTDKKLDMFVKVFNSSWYRFFWQMDSKVFLEQIRCPVLCINGDRDYIATASKNFPKLEQCLKKAGNQDFTCIELHGLNHAFQTCQTGSLFEYGTIQETLAPQTLNVIGDWIMDHVQ